MPTKARWLIKTALLHLLLGLILAGVRSAQGAGWVPGNPGVWWLPQLHLITVGWITQLIFGVAYWLFPRPRSGMEAWKETVVWVGYVALNGGLLLRVVLEPAETSSVMEAWGLGLSAALQWIAGCCFVGHLWIRVRKK
ncbi:hypothetical protein CRI94_01000 [Longibacter salinarum]|uniref:Uncharacterized protein n=1 Tax=Longibacter salinarum TaxID=1850348 RepID=A0A2A8D257_9BACT|nr:hypothetical protein [Longibacter salinarum]PEN14903.1 hypothetical protein CRI94_01000 [Longibacter salinarum]